ncbi:MAG: alpha/beta hydrolase [Chloroflexi bacterium]|nr:alpha/beta hydrolase [Chloroflexota bacterium]
MTTNPVMIQSSRVTTEGDELFYEVRGQGQPLLMIAPGGGDGWQYSFVADILADEYKVITYDRRANARSTMNVPQNFEISQQSRDAVAVLRAAGETSAFVFGNSSAAVIALDMAKTQPQAVRAVVVHEAPIPRVLPNARKWQRFFAGVYLTAFRFGSSLAALQFMLGVELPVRQLIKATRDVNIHREQSSERYISSKDSVDVLAKLELLPVTNYLPDVERIRQNGVRVFMAVGKCALDKKTWYAQAAQILAEQLGCELVTFPGHHGSFMDMPAEWAATLRSVLHKAEGVNQG